MTSVKDVVVSLQHLGVSENVVYPIVPNGFADHYPYEKWLFHWEYTLFSYEKFQSRIPQLGSLAVADNVGCSPILAETDQPVHL